MSAALESYKADNGVYPSSTDTEALDPQVHVDPATNYSARYAAASLYLFEQLSGLNPNQTPIANAKRYLTFKPKCSVELAILRATSTPFTSIRDPFGNTYGYSTKNSIRSDR